MKIDNTQDHIIIPDTEDSGTPVFVVTAYRHGNRDNHSYVVGVYEVLDDALTLANKEEVFRANKYVCEVVEMKINGDIWAKGCKTIKRINDDHDNREVCE